MVSLCLLSLAYHKGTFSMRVEKICVQEVPVTCSEEKVNIAITFFMWFCKLSALDNVPLHGSFQLSTDEHFLLSPRWRGQGLACSVSPKGVKCPLPWLPSRRTSQLLIPQCKAFPLWEAIWTFRLWLLHWFLSVTKDKINPPRLWPYMSTKPRPPIPKFLIILIKLLIILDDPFQAPGNQSLIPLEKAEAQFLFIVGQDDRVVKSEYHATEVCKLLQAQGKENFQILSYPGTGHCIDPPFFPLYPIGSHPVFHKRAVLGGELRAYSKAQVHAWSQIQAFFKKYLIVK